jgi:hypothetical protein
MSVFSNNINFTCSLSKSFYENIEKVIELVLVRNIILKPCKNDWWRVTINQEVWMVYSACFYFLSDYATTPAPTENHQ